MSTKGYIFKDPNTGRRAVVVPAPDMKIVVSDDVRKLAGTGKSDLDRALVVLLAEHYTQLEPWDAKLMGPCAQTTMHHVLGDARVTIVSFFPHQETLVMLSSEYADVCPV